MGDKHNQQMNMCMGMTQDPLMGPQFQLARSYVRIQQFNRQYCPDVALMRGTIFPELYRPYTPMSYSKH